MAKNVIAGLARNCSSTLTTELSRIEKAFKNHHIVHSVIVESDSQDNSAEILNVWSAEPDKNSLFLLGQLANTHPKRSERLAYCRNVYMKFLEQQDFFHADYLFVADLDGVNSDLTSDSMDQALEALRLIPGSAATANQAYKYYDIWALRHAVWSPNDCWTSFHQMRRSFGDVIAHRICVETRMIHIDQQLLPPIEVESAFGGGAIYSTAMLAGCRYQGIEGDREICEHVSFSKIYRKNGGRIFIHPGFINHDISEHVLNAMRFEWTLKTDSMIDDNAN